MPKIQVNFQQGIAVAISLTLPFSSFSRPVNANPAVLAPAVLCAGTAGVGCVLVGVGVLGGTVIYFVYQNDQGRKVKLTSNGRLFRHEDYTQDPDKIEEVGTWEDPLDTKNRSKAVEICRNRAKKIGATYELKQDPATKKWICVFTGGTGR